MGNKCGCGREEDPNEALKLHNLVRIQALARSYLAKSKKKRLRDDKLKGLFSKSPLA